MKKKDNMHLAYPILRIDAVDLKRKATINFLESPFDENLTWKDHINTIENQISKMLGSYSE